MLVASLNQALLDIISVGGLLQLLAKGLLITILGLFFHSEFALSAAAVKNRIAVGTVACLAMLPILSCVAPTWVLPLLPASESAPVGLPSSPWLAVGLWVYLLVAAILSVRLLLQILRTGIISMRSRVAPAAWYQSLDSFRGAKDLNLKMSEDVPGPLTWGLIKPTILVPPECGNWSKCERELTLRHEVAHIERGDWLTVLVARWVGILYWPVPGMGRLLKVLSLSAEQACDDRVLASGAQATDYADVLVKQARREWLPASLALAESTGLEIRVRYLVMEIVDRSTLDSKHRWVYPLCALIIYPLAITTLGQEPVGMHMVPLQRMERPSVHAEAEQLSAMTPLARRPARPKDAEPPPPAPSLTESIQWEGEKPTIPPPSL